MNQNFTRLQRVVDENHSAIEVDSLETKSRLLYLEHAQTKVQSKTRPSISGVVDP